MLKKSVFCNYLNILFATVTFFWLFLTKNKTIESFHELQRQCPSTKVSVVPVFKKDIWPMYQRVQTDKVSDERTWRLITTEAKKKLMIDPIESLRFLRTQKKTKHKNNSARPTDKKFSNERKFRQVIFSSLIMPNPFDWRKHFSTGVIFAEDEQITRTSSSFTVFTIPWNEFLLTSVESRWLKSIRNFQLRKKTSRKF